MKKQEKANEEFSILFGEPKNILKFVNNVIILPRNNAHQTQRFNINTNKCEKYFQKIFS